jgi:6-phosphogluconolactonase (cycloisomerase 2 family)
MLALALGTIGASVSIAASGNLSSRGCLEDTGGPEDCTRSSLGLAGATAIEVSPDGKDAYLVGSEDDAVVHLRRNLRTGALSAVECIDDEAPSGPDACARSVDGLEQAVDLAISRNGRHVYTIAYAESTLLHFQRNQRTGRLQLKHCVDDADLAVVDDVCPGGAEGLQGPSELALSRDGDSLYVASQLDEALVTFRLNRRGKPLYRNCFEDDDKFLADDCPRDREALADAGDVAVAPDGRSVYVTSFTDDAVGHFGRNPRTGLLGYRGCVENRSPDGADECDLSAHGLLEPGSVGLSPDGRFLYTGAVNQGAMAQFKLGRRGQPQPRGCVEQPFSSALCATTAQGIGRAADFIFDAKGRSLYVAGGRGIQPFKREPGSGSLTELPCIEDDDLPPIGTSCARTAPGLTGAFSAAISPDDRWLYVAASADDTVSVFRRR